MSMNGIPPLPPVAAHIPYCENRLDSLLVRVVTVCSARFSSSTGTNVMYGLVYVALANVNVGVFGFVSVLEDCMYSSPLKLPKWESAIIRLQRSTAQNGQYSPPT